jgi:hypothetical protein
MKSLAIQGCNDLKWRLSKYARHFPKNQNTLGKKKKNERHTDVN